MSVFNGQTTYDHHTPIHHENHRSRCLFRGGGRRWRNCANSPANFINDNEFSITHYELINLLVALKVWSQAWQHKRVVFKVDNLAVVTICNSEYIRCKHLATMVRNIWLETAKYDIEMKVMHIPGKVNRVADLLSQWNNTYTNNVELQSW